MKSTATLIFALILVTSSFGSPQAAALRSNVTVESEFVRLGDVFAEAGKNADAIIAGAPAPGQKEIFSTQRLWSIARKHGMDWKPTSRYDRVTVERAGQPIDQNEIEQQVRQKLIDAGMPEDYQIQLTSRNHSLFAPVGSERPFTVHNLRFDARSGRFAALVVVPTGDRSVIRSQITGKTHSMIQVPVLTRRVNRNEIITRSDVHMVLVRKGRLDRNALLETDQIVGMAARRSLKADTPLRGRELQKPIVVRKGSLVTLVIRSKNMILTVKGRAMQNGATGDAVRVMNTRSKNSVEGIVDSPSRVIVTASNEIN